MKIKRGYEALQTGNIGAGSGQAALATASRKDSL
jgi:uncharacterized membrane-anchored protein